MSIIYPSQGFFPRWSNWLIDFTDLTDELVKKLGDNKLVISPDPVQIVLSASASSVLTDSSILTTSPNDPGAAKGQLTIKNINSTQAITVSHKNYYYNTAKGLIDIANQKVIDESQLNAVTPMHYILIQWQIAYLQEQVCKDNIGLNDNVDAMVDKYRGKMKDYYAERIAWQGKINYELFNTAAMQQSFTRAPSRTFDIFI